jgi:autotransporter-associated beta strand protein
MKLPAGRKSLFVLAACVAALLAPSVASAQTGSATWIGGTSSIWSDPTNWNPNQYPDGATDVGTFDNTATSFTPTISGTDPTPAITVGDITFGATAPQAFTITVTGTNAAPASLTISGTGVTNSSTFTQAFAITGNYSGDGVAPTSTTASASLTFNNSASAGNNTSYTITNGGAAYMNGSSSAGTNTTWSIDSTSAMYFAGTSNGTTTTTIINSGTFDISQQAGGVTVGSISGLGSIFLGGNTLNTNVAAGASATISGTIQDGGVAGGVGGVLTVNGPGTLILTAANTYTGGTQLANGSLFLNDSPTGVGNTSTAATPSKAIGSGPLTITSVPGGVTTLGTATDGQALANTVNVGGDFTIVAAPGISGPPNFYFTGPINLTPPTGTLANTITGSLASAQINFEGVISGSAANVGINFLGGASGYTAFIYNGTAGNTYTGLTTVGNNAFLVLQSASENENIVVGNVLVNPGGSFDMLASFQTAPNITVTVNSAGLSAGGTGLLAGFELQESSEIIGTLLGDSTGVVGLGSGTLTVSNGNFAGTIGDGSSGFTGGNLIVAGPGILNLSGTSTYTGATTVAGGTLQAGSSTGFSPNSAFTVNTGGILDVNGFDPTVGSLAGAGIVTNNSTTLGALITGFSSTNTSFTGTLQDGAGPLSLVKTGFGTQTIFNSTYSGPTAVVLGILQAGSTTAFSPNSAFSIFAPGALDLNGFNNRIGSLAGDGTVANEGSSPATLTTGLDNTNTIFSGTIQDGVSTIALVKTGTGSMTLASSNTFTGGTTLQNGSLIVESVLALGAGNVTVTGGALKAGGTPIDIQVGGNYTQTSGGELELRIGGTTSGTFDRLAVVGSAALGGRLNLVSLNGFVPTRGTSITIVDAGGAVTGQFQQVTGSFSNLQHINLTLEYEPNDVILEFTGTSFSGLSDLTPNEKAVAVALDNVVLNDQSNKALNYLDALSSAKSLRAAFDRIAPEEYAVIYQISTSSAKVQATSVEGRLDAIHAGPIPAGAGGPVGPADPNSPTPPTPPDALFGVYANTSGEFVSVADSSNAAGYNFDSGGFTVGADYRFEDNFVAGVLLNYTRTRADLVNNGRLDADGIRAGLYASLFGSGLYVNGFIGAGYNDYGMNRQGLDAKVTGNTNGGEFNSFVQTGYDKKIGDFTVGPVAALNYTYTGLSSFQEQGSLDPLSVDSYREQSVRTNIGARATYQWHLGKYIIAPEIRATWQHEYADVVDSVTASMLFGSPRFTVNSTPIGRDSLLLNVGFTLTITPQIVAYLYYDGELARMNYQANNIMMGFRVDF